jgi:hypothetical protein
MGGGEFRVTRIRISQMGRALFEVTAPTPSGSPPSSEEYRIMLWVEETT